MEKQLNMASPKRKQIILVSNNIPLPREQHYNYCIPGQLNSPPGSDKHSINSLGYLYPKHNLLAISQPPGFLTKQVSHPPADRSGPGLSADTQQASPCFFLFFFSVYTGLNTTNNARVQAKTQRAPFSKITNKIAWISLAQAQSLSF